MMGREVALGSTADIARSAFDACCWGCSGCTESRLAPLEEALP